jgi:hypothetical protein
MCYVFVLLPSTRCTQWYVDWMPVQQLQLRVAAVVHAGGRLIL